MSRAHCRRFALAGLCLWLAAAGAAAQERNLPGWKEVAIPAAHFKVLMPGAPKTSRQTIRTDIGNVASTRYTVIDAANVTYDVLFNEYPAAGVSKTNPQKLLDGARDGLLYQTKGRMIAEKHITLANFPGRDQLITDGSGAHYRVRLVWAGNRLYQIMAASPGKPRPDAELFIDSFQITGKR
jgi:hypothetical protein